MTFYSVIYFDFQQCSDEFDDGPERFFTELGSGSADDIPETSSEDDAEAEAAANREVKLYKVRS